MEKSLSVGDVIEVTAERMAYGGDAIARYGRLAIFIPLAAPGDRLRVRVTEKKKSFARAAIEQILSGSDARREPPCRYFGSCGGCQLQHLSYPAQLEAKAGFVRDALTRIGRISWPGDVPIRSAAEFGYRARAQVKIEPGREGSARVGFNRTGSWSVCDIESCPVLTPAMNEALASLRSSSAASGLAEVEVAAGDSGISFEPGLPGLPSGPVTQEVLGIRYSFSPGTFFQVNPLLLEQMVSEAVGDASGQLAIDLFAGVGLFTLQLARRFGRVIGVESDARAAAFALKNIQANNLSNVEYHNARTEEWLSRFVATGQSARLPAPDLVLLDPPRSGAAGAIERILTLKSRRVTYVSCDPTTLARDLRGLLDGGYSLSTVTAFDLFPQTYHVETVASLTLQ